MAINSQKTTVKAVIHMPGRGFHDASKNQAAKYRELVDSLKEVVYEMDLEANITFANQAALGFFGLSREDLENGVNAIEYIDPADRPRAVADIKRVFSGYLGNGQEYNIRKKDGTLVPVIIHATPIIQGGKPKGIRGFIIDITIQKLLENERQRLAEFKHNLMTNISHDLLSPLTIINGYIETILSGYVPDPEEQKKLLCMIQDKIAMIDQLTRDLFDITQLESRQVKLNLAPTSPVKLLNIIFKKYKPDINNQGIACKLEAPPRSRKKGVQYSEVNVDPGQIERVFANLIFNAIKYTPSGGTVTIGLAPALPTSNEVLYYIKDTGPGMPAADIPFIFERYYMGSKSKPGSGLGLAIAKEIVNCHGGQIWVDTEPGAGCTFSFTLPVLKLFN